MKLGVNVDHVATLREARYRRRGFGEPDPVEAALVCEAAGAEGVTAHLREDRRHMQDRDLRQLRERIGTRLNLEMGNLPAMVDFALDLKPEIVCLVPERREEVTTEGGLDVAGQAAALGKTCDRLRQAGIQVSLFIDPQPAQVEAAARTGAEFVELHTGTFAERFYVDQKAETEVRDLVEASKLAHSLGLRVNAGHGLNAANVPRLFRVPHLVELNIGHSLVSRSVLVGLDQAVREMIQVMRGYPQAD